MLTAPSEIEGRGSAPDVGADDSLAKPFDFRAFDARCRLLLGRSQSIASSVTRVGTLEFDRGHKAVTGETVDLLTREFRLLEILNGSLGRVLSKDDACSQRFDFDDEAGGTPSRSTSAGCAASLGSRSAFERCEA